MTTVQDFTPEEFAEAVARYKAFCEAHPDDWSDFTCGSVIGYEKGLTFVMGTYAEWCWAKFFGRPTNPPHLKLVGS